MPCLTIGPTRRLVGIAMAFRRQMNTCRRVWRVTRKVVVDQVVPVAQQATTSDAPIDTCSTGTIVIVDRLVALAPITRAEASSWLHLQRRRGVLGHLLRHYHRAHGGSRNTLSSLKRRVECICFTHHGTTNMSMLINNRMYGDNIPGTIVTCTGILYQPLPSNLSIRERTAPSQLACASALAFDLCVCLGVCLYLSLSL